LIIIGDFEIRDHNWNPSYLYYSIYGNILRKIADSLNLELLLPIVQISTHYSNNPQDSNSVLDLIFFHANIEEFNNYMILPDLWSSSNHTPLLVNIVIEKEVIQDKR